MNQKRKHTNLRLVTRVVAGVLLAGALPASQAQSLIHRWSFKQRDRLGGQRDGEPHRRRPRLAAERLHVNGASGAGSFGSVNVTADFAANSSITIEGWFTTAVVAELVQGLDVRERRANANVGTSYLDFTPNRGDNLNPGISIKPLSSNGDFAYEPREPHQTPGSRCMPSRPTITQPIRSPCTLTGWRSSRAACNPPRSAHSRPINSASVRALPGGSEFQRID